MSSSSMWSAFSLALVWVTALALMGCSGGSGLSQTTGASSTSGSVVLATAPATTPTAATLKDETTTVVSPAQVVAAQVSASVVNVRVKGVTVSPFWGEEQYEGVGSGIVYEADGYILTNDHVVSVNGRAADSVVVTLATGETLDAKIIARDATHDLALLKVDRTGLLPVVFAQSKTVEVGQWAIAIGSPLDYRNSVTEGIVSGLDRDLSTGDPTAPRISHVLQTDAAISPGNSGGGLFNAAGQLIGMPEAYLPSSTGAENIGFAIPADTVASVAKQLLGN